MTKHRRIRRAFTLLELLVVLSILTIIGSMMLPAMAKAKARGQGIKCLSNMRQWGLALSVYTSDFDDRLPRDGTDGADRYATDTGAVTGPGSPADPFAWFNVLPANTGELPLSKYWATSSQPREHLPFPGASGTLWHCPAARATADDPFMRGGMFGFFSIVMNRDLKLLTPVRNSVPGRSMPYPDMPRADGLPFPSATVGLTDVAFSPTLEPFTGTAERNGTTPAGRSSQFAQRHSSRGANIVFVDGHAAFFKRSYITNGTRGRAEKPNRDVVWNPNRDK